MFIASSSVAVINRESLFFEAISWENILGHYLKDLDDLFDTFDTQDTGGNPKGEA